MKIDRKRFKQGMECIRIHENCDICDYCDCEGKVCIENYNYVVSTLEHIYNSNKVIIENK